MSKGARTCLTASERSVMYGKVKVVLGHPFPSSCLWARVVVDKTRGVSILLKCVHNLHFFFHTRNTEDDSAIGPGHQSSPRTATLCAIGW